MFTCKMHWDGLIDYHGNIEARAGIQILNTSSREEALDRAYKFFENGSFIIYSALLENGDFIAEIERD